MEFLSLFYFRFGFLWYLHVESEYWFSMQYICFCLLRTLIKWNVISWQFCSIYIIHGRSVGAPDKQDLQNKHVLKDYDIIFYNSNITVSLFSKFLAFRSLQKYHIKHKWANLHIFKALWFPNCPIQLTNILLTLLSITYAIPNN
jgi:hypothetical protein